MPNFSARSKNLKSVYAEERISQRGSILPLTAILVAILSALLMGVTQTVHSSSQENIFNEKIVHEKMKVIFEETTQLNAIANINLEMAERSMELLDILQKIISWGFNIASTTPLWEQNLPIPEKYDIFRKIDLALAPLIKDFDILSEMQLLHKRKLKIIQDKSAFQISLLQSLCSLKCIKKQSSIISSESCNRPFATTTDCRLNLKTPISTWPQQKTISLASILTHSLAHRPGFMLTESGQILDLVQKSNVPHQTSGAQNEHNPRVGIVHPRLCAHPKNSFRVPCTASVMSTSQSRKNNFVLAFEPHWSVAVEF